MNIGLYFGSFNPIHVGHLIIANHILNHTDLEKVWFIVSPQNPLKSGNTLLNEYDRLHLVRVAIEDDNRMKASDIEFTLPRPSYAVDTLTYLKEKYPEHNFSVIIGADSYQNLHRWKNYEVILNDYRLFIYKRPGYEFGHVANPNVNVLDAPLLDISATAIRESIKENKSIRYMVPPRVLEEIEKGNYYKK